MARGLWTLLVAAVLAAAWSAGCERGAQAPREPGPVRVVVSIPPLAGLCRALLPDDAEVRVLVEAGRSPHGFEPTPSDIAAIGRADLVVLVGMGIESFLPASVRSGERVVVMAEAIGVSEGDAPAHEGHEHAHGEGDADPHLWLDPVLVERFLPTLAERVGEILPRAGVGAEGLEAARAAVALQRARVLAIDEAYRRRLAPHAGAAIITQHAAWSRLAVRYGLEVVGVIQPSEAVEPSPGQLAEVIAAGKEHRVRAVFTESQLDARLARRVAEQLGASVGTLDPLGRGDWEAMMQENLDTLVGVIGLVEE
jgi:ABC-type Zn uptake system ZnuABC Zn-binding protein ZnuA